MHIPSVEDSPIGIDYFPDLIGSYIVRHNACESLCVTCAYGWLQQTFPILIPGSLLGCWTMRGLTREVEITIDHGIDGEDVVGPVIGLIIPTLPLNIITNPIFQTLTFMVGELPINQVLCRDLLFQSPSKPFLFQSRVGEERRQKKRQQKSTVAGQPRRGHDKKQSARPSGQHQQTIEEQRTECQPDLVVNLSQVVLTPLQHQVLNKGLSFIPTTRLDKFQLRWELAEFFRKIRLKAFFKGQQVAQQKGDTGLRLKSKFCPPVVGIAPEILAFEQAVVKATEEIDASSIHTFHNLSTIEREAIKSLQQNKNLVIKPADKGGAIVLMSKEDYQLECRRLLSNERHYKIITEDPTHRLNNTIKNLLEEAEVNSWISQQEADFLLEKSPTTPC